MRVLLDGEFFAEWQHDLDELARFAGVDVNRLSRHPEDEAKETREKKKKQRAQSLKSLKVTTSDGNEYDADEESQDRIARTLLAIGDGTVKWTMADNRSVRVNAAELEEALYLAVAQTSTLWEL